MDSWIIVDPANYGAIIERNVATPGFEVIPVFVNNAQSPYHGSYVVPADILLNPDYDVWHDVLDVNTTFVTDAENLFIEPV